MACVGKSAAFEEQLRYQAIRSQTYIQSLDFKSFIHGIHHDWTSWHCRRQKVLRQFRRRHLEAVVATLSDNLDWRESENFLLGDRNPYLSPAAVVDGVFGRIAREFQDYRAGPTELIDAGDVVVAIGRSKGIMASTGKPFDAQYMHVVRVADGKIVGFHQLIDTLEIWRSQQAG